MDNNNSLENEIEIENDQLSMPTTPHMKVIPAKRDIESWQINEKFNGNFFFTTDLWTHDHSPYIGVMIHWMTPDFKIRQALLTIESFKYPHTGDNIEDCLRKEFKKWNITEKLFGGTTDNDSAMINVLDPIASDTETRWNINKLVFDPERTTRSNGDSLKKLLLSSEDWGALEELISLLRPFVDATNLTSGSSYLTLSLWYPTLYCLREYLKSVVHTLTNLQIIIVCNEILASLYRCWDIPDELETPTVLPSTSFSSNTSMFIDFFNHHLSSQPSTSQIDIEISLYLQLPSLF
ncbi:14608_t:CDS:2, partial [Cetraspora pellucida]